MRMTLTYYAGAELKMLSTPLKVNLREKVVLLSVGRTQWIKTAPVRPHHGQARQGLVTDHQRDDSSNTQSAEL